MKTTLPFLFNESITKTAFQEDLNKMSTGGRIGEEKLNIHNTS